MKFVLLERFESNAYYLHGVSEKLISFPYLVT